MGESDESHFSVHPASDEEVARLKELHKYWERPDVLVLLAQRDAEDAAREQARQAQQVAPETTAEDGE